MKKKILQTVLFLGIMFLTFYTLLHGQNLSEIYQAVKNMSVPYLIAAAGLALFFVCAEGSMIWYLLTSMRKKADSQTTVLWCCWKKKKVMFSVALYPIFVYWIFLFGHHTIRNRWAAGAALLYEQRWKQRF